MTEIKPAAPRGAHAPRPKKPQPLIRSVLALRIAVAALTTLSLGGMTAYAGSHVYNSNAPLVVTVPQATSVTTVASSVRTTTATPVTVTRQS
jgi:hypothetical protein